MILNATKQMAVAAGLALLAVAGCSSDNGEETVPAGVNLTGTVNNHGTASASNGMELELDNFYFGPTFLKATPNQRVRVELYNEGSVAHTFTIDTPGVDHTLAAGQRMQIELTAPPNGFTRFYCKFHDAQGMQGAIFVA